MNVVLIVAHGLNVHWLGPYGNAWVSTPVANALASHGIVFDRHFAAVPSVQGFRTGFPSDLADRLQASGIALHRIDDRHDPGDDRPPGDRLLAAVRAAIPQRPTGVTWIETDRLLPPWDLEYETYQQYAETGLGFTRDLDPDEISIPEPTDAPPLGPVGRVDDITWHQWRNSFAAAVTAWDADLGRLIEHCDGPETAIVLTSGFGLPLGEHGVVGPVGSRMFSELVHVPLIVRLPGDSRAMSRVSALTESADLWPTVADLLGLGSAPNSLCALLTGGPWDREAVRQGVDDEQAVRTERWAFLPATAGHPAQLFGKPDDTWEVNDVAIRHPDECDQLLTLGSRPHSA